MTSANGGRGKPQLAALPLTPIQQQYRAHGQARVRPSIPTGPTVIERRMQQRRNVVLHMLSPKSPQRSKDIAYTLSLPVEQIRYLLGQLQREGQVKATGPKGWVRVRE